MSKAVIDEQSGPATEASRTSSTEPDALLSVQQVARLLNCSTRHVRRLIDRGAMPSCVRLGTLSRWRPQEIEEWITAGCKPVRSATERKR